MPPETELANAVSGLLVAVHDEAIHPVSGEELERFVDRGRIIVVTVGQQGPTRGAQSPAELLEHCGMEFAH